MSDEKRVRVDTSENVMKEVDWRVNWIDHLQDVDLTDKRNCMLQINVARGEIRGVVKRGKEVIDVNLINDMVELIIVNVINHSIKVFAGVLGEELYETDMTDLDVNGVANLPEDNERWEGGIWRGFLFGYGSLYNAENQLLYEGWIIDGKKRCYGTDYWSDTGMMRYTGYFFDGMRHGYGILYKADGMPEYEGVFKDGYAIQGNDIFAQWSGDEDLVLSGLRALRNGEITLESYVRSLKKDELILSSCVESLTIADEFKRRDIRSLSFDWSLLLLKRIKIGKNCFEKVQSFVIDGLSELESLSIGDSSIKSSIYEPGTECVIMNCDRLNDMYFGKNAFYRFLSLELRNLPSLISVRFDEASFRMCHSVVFEGMIIE